MPDAKPRQDSSWFAELLLTQPSDYREPDGSAPNRHRLFSGTANFLALAMVGFAIGAAGVIYADNRPAFDTTRLQLVKRVEESRGQVQSLEAANSRLRATNAQLNDFILPDLDNQLAGELAVAREFGGYDELSGAGVSVLLTEPTGGSEFDRVIDADLQVLVNGLWAAGAEGIAINGIRLTPSTPIREAAGVIQVDYQPISQPYRVAAVGTQLRERLRATVAEPWLADLESNYSVSVTYSKRARLQLPAGRLATISYAEEAGQ